MVSYADFITLLFAFFVVMYSVSSVNEGKYRVLSESLNSAFRPSPTAVADEPAAAAGSAAELVQPLSEAKQEMEALSGEISKMMSRYIEDDLVAVRRNDMWLEIEVKTRLLFSSGSALPSPSARPVLDQLAGYFSLVPNAIQVEGYTDNEPISTPLFPSNWELSSARAAAVVRLMVESGVEPERMASVGYAEFRPIADNSSREGRMRNRRVVIKLMADVESDSAERLQSLRALQAQVDSGQQK